MTHSSNMTGSTISTTGGFQKLSGKEHTRATPAKPTDYETDDGNKVLLIFTKLRGRVSRELLTPEEYCKERNDEFPDYDSYLAENLKNVEATITDGAYRLELNFHSDGDEAGAYDMYLADEDDWRTSTKANRRPHRAGGTARRSFCHAV